MTDLHVYPFHLYSNAYGCKLVYGLGSVTGLRGFGLTSKYCASFLLPRSQVGLVKNMGFKILISVLIE